MSLIHSTAVVDRTAKLGVDVSVGPFCVIEGDVEIGDGTRIESRAVIKSGTRIGTQNRIGEGVVLGGAPQHAACPARTGRLQMGDRNVVRENATVHRALKESDVTVVGDDNLIMVNAHVGHDCVVGSKIIMANNAMLGGHVHIGDRAFISGAVGIHQFCRVGTLAMVGGQAHINRDVPPFVTVDGLTSRVVGLNLIGLRRAGLSGEMIRELKLAYRIVFRMGLRWSEAIDQLMAITAGPVVELRQFLESTKRGCVLERRSPRSALWSLRGEPHDEPVDDLGETRQLRIHKPAA
jgi:UDP-N-acetylglucosamine acyltransferase